MRSSRIVALSGMAASVAAWEKGGSFDFGTRLDFNLTNSPSTACDFFKQNFANMTLLPEDSGYTAENEGNYLNGCLDTLADKPASILDSWSLARSCLYSHTSQFRANVLRCQESR